MMMKLADPIVLEMKSLVSEGIAGVKDAGSPFPDFYQDLVRDYFKARKVEIDYVQEVVKVEIPVGEHRYTQVNISCQPLEQFLASPDTFVPNNVMASPGIKNSGDLKDLVAFLKLHK